MKIVINSCFGGFGLSNKAFELYLTLKNIPFETTESKYKFKPDDKLYWKQGMVDDDDGLLWARDVERNDPVLVRVVEELGSEEASDHFAELKVVEIPDDVDWYVSEYDGLEHVAEHHRTWG